MVERYKIDSNSGIRGGCITAPTASKNRSKRGFTNFSKFTLKVITFGRTHLYITVYNTKNQEQSDVIRCALEIL